MTHQELGEKITGKSQLPLSLVIIICAGIVTFTFFQATMYTNVQDLKKQNDQIIARLDRIENVKTLANQ